LLGLNKKQAMNWLFETECIIFEYVKFQFVTKKAFAIFFPLAYGLPMTPCDANSWNQKAGYYGAQLVYQFTFTLADKCYFGCGTKFDSIGPGFYYRDFWMFDPVTNSYTQQADFGGTGRANAIGFAVNGKGYAGTCPFCPIPLDFWEYEPASNTWNQKADVPLQLSYGVDRKSFPTMNYGYVLVLGNGSPAGLWQYDPANDAWQQKSPCPVSLMGGMHFSIGTNLFFGIGRVDSSVSNLFSNAMYRYHETIDQWAPVAAFPGLAREYGASFAIGQKGYVGMGNGPNWPLYYTDFWQYDLQTNAWIQAASFPGLPRNTYLSFSTSTHGFAGIGFVNVVFPSLYFNDLWEYTPGTITGTGATEIVEMPALTVSPNVCSHAVWIKATRLVSRFVELAIYDHAGLMIKRYSLRTSDAELNEAMDVSALLAGVYLVSLRDGQATRSARFIKAM
jgi:hypothetical protein